MPAGRGGSLDEATYTGITAYILHANGATPGTHRLHAGHVRRDRQHRQRQDRAMSPIRRPVARAASSGRQDCAASVPARAGLAPPPAAVDPIPAASRLPSKFGLTLKGDIQNYVPVTDAMMTNPPDGDWLMYRRNYQGWSYSPLKQINTANVKSAAAEMDVVDAGERHHGDHAHRA